MDHDRPEGHEPTVAADIDLVARCRDGSDEAWRALFDAHFDFVRRVALRLGTPDAEVDDVCQEAFLVAWRKLDTFVDGRFSTWLYRITANVVSSRHRRRRVRAALSELLGRLGGRRSAPDTPEDAVRRGDARRRVADVLAAMAPKKREVFALYELEGLSGAEVAERVGCNARTVRTRLFHARRDFARLARRRGYLESI